MNIDFSHGSTENQSSKQELPINFSKKIGTVVILSISFRASVAIVFYACLWPYAPNLFQRALHNNLLTIIFATMKNCTYLLLFLIFIYSCNSKDSIPDVSNIKITATINRFDKEFFAIDSNNVLPGLNHVFERYPFLTKIFLQNILGLDSASTLPGVKRFLHLNAGIYESANQEFKEMNKEEKDFKKAFQFVKYYFPDYKLPGIVTVVGPIDAMAQKASGATPNFLGPDFLGLSLQFYLGKDYPIYKDPFFIDNVAPTYRSRRFSREYIVPDAIQLIVDDLFPDKSGNLPLIEQMVEKGKQWWLLDKFLPEMSDSVKTGYTKQQLEWCSGNEGLIWSYLVKNEDLGSMNPTTIQAYIGEGPFTQGFSQELSPGNLGQWIGWRIVKKFAGKNPKLSPAEIMKTDPKRIVDEAQYKPK